MIIYGLFFYAFAALLVISSVTLITVKNPVPSVLWLIFAFFNTAGLFILLDAEFLAMTIVIVYVGAVAVLFLFVVMMLNINLIKLKEGFAKNLPICILIALVLLVDIILIVTKSSETKDILINLPAKDFIGLTNTHAIASVLYTKFMPIFIIAGLILLVAMISAIILTHRSRTNVRRQNSDKQISQSVKKSISLVKVENRKGVLS